MRIEVLVEGYKPLVFDVPKFVTIDTAKTVIEIEKLKDGRVRAIFSKSLLEAGE